MSKATALVGVAVAVVVLGACGNQPASTAGAGDARDNLEGILFASIDGSASKLYVTDTSGSASHIATGDLEAYSADWSPDKSQIVFIGNPSDPGNPDLYIMNADGSDMHRVLQTPAIEGDATWSPDGQTIYFWQSHDDGTWLVRGLDIATGELHTVPGTVNGDGQVDVSPSGNQLGVVRNVRGDMSIELVGLAGSADASIQNGVGSLSWSPSGEQLAYTDAKGTVNLKDLASGNTTQVALPGGETRAGEVEWGPSEDVLLVRSSAVGTQGTAEPVDLYLVETSTGEVTTVDLGVEEPDYFGGISWE